MEPNWHLKFTPQLLLSMALYAAPTNGRSYDFLYSFVGGEFIEPCLLTSCPDYFGMAWRNPEIIPKLSAHVGAGINKAPFTLSKTNKGRKTMNNTNDCNNCVTVIPVNKFKFVFSTEKTFLKC